MGKGLQGVEEEPERKKREQVCAAWISGQIEARNGARKERQIDEMEHSCFTVNLHKSALIGDFV